MIDAPTLRSRLAELTWTEACRLLGPRGAELLGRGGKWDASLDQTDLTDARLRLVLPDAVVAVRMGGGAGGLASECSRCRMPCAHVGALLALVLEEKRALGLVGRAEIAAKRANAAVGETQLVAAALARRAERAISEDMTVTSADPNILWTDYTVTSVRSGKSYKVALRGTEPGISFCSCPDFRKNTLGTCKHLLRTLHEQRKAFPPETFRRPYLREHITVHLFYGTELELRVALPAELTLGAESLIRPFVGAPVRDLRGLLRCIAELERSGSEVVVYPDAEEYIEGRLLQERLQRKAAELRADAASHPLLHELLAVELRPYQLEGIAFAVGAGRSVLADDMGLGKTLQAIGAAELLALEAGIQRVLVVCPASVKAQWREEIAGASGRSCQVVLGDAEERGRQYDAGAFYTVCNYEQVLRDVDAVMRVRWDLIVLDEGQRIKNWEAKTSEVVKGLRSPFALVLSGTPLQNKLDELYSVIEFVDDRRLAPAFRFYERHQLVDEAGRVVGYKHLDVLRENLAPVLLRRTRAQVLDELPPRTTEILRIAPSQRQRELHDEHLRTVAAIASKPFIGEVDLLRLRKALTGARLAANASTLQDQQRPVHSTKLDELNSLLGRLGSERERKIVVFSEWTGMLDLIEELLDSDASELPAGFGRVRLDGSVPQARREELVRRFQEDEDCQLFLTTNAGAMGLNLQAANTVVNVDLPWNPGVLEQRVARAHRMGQVNPVHVFLLVSEGTLEERMLGTLSSKQELFEAVLDPDAVADSVEVRSSVQELKTRVAQLLGESSPVNQPDADSAHARAAAAAGRLLEGAVELLAELLPEPAEDDNVATMALRSALAERLASGFERDDRGRPTLRVSLPSEEALERLAGRLAHLLLEDPELTPYELQPTAKQPKPARPRSGGRKRTRK